MNKNTLIGLSILSGVLLALPWHNHFSGIISTIAFVPLLFIEDQLSKTRNKNTSSTLFIYSSLAFLLWNIISTYWIKNSDVLAAFVVILTNTSFMSLTFGLFHITKRKFGDKIGNYSFILYWLSFEYIFLNTHLTWPWLNLGNAFADNIKLIQWYEYTGILGGTFWILTLNIILFLTLKSYFKNKNRRVLSFNLSAYLLCILLPIGISHKIFNSYKETGKEINISILQPNFDPYTEKYSIDQDQQLDTIIKMANTIVCQNTDYIIAPETAISEPIWENNLNTDSSILMIKEFINHYNNLSFIIGANTHKRILPEQKIPITSKYDKKGKFYYNTYNTALQIDTSMQIPTYYKSKLVSGVETMPFLNTFGFLEKLFIDFGGITGSLGIQKEREVFTNTNLNISIAPVICYESAFGEHVSDFIKEGANIIFILTNDGWWGNSPGYKQHFRLSRIRAIENRRSIARCANTGISAFINQKGEIIKKSEWWVKTSISASLKTNSTYTTYTKYGDFIGRISIFVSIILFLYTIINIFFVRKQ